MPDENVNDSQPVTEIAAGEVAKTVDDIAVVAEAVKEEAKPANIDMPDDAFVGMVSEETLNAAKAIVRQDTFEDLLTDAGIMGKVNKADVTPEQMKSFIVGGKDPKTGEVVELWVPRNIPRLIGDLLMSAETYGEEFLNSELEVCRYLGNDANTLIKFRLCKGKAGRVIEFLKTLVLTPQQAVREVMKMVNGIFEHSTCGIASFALMFMDSGLTGNIIQNDGLLVNEAEVKMFFNGIHGQANEYGEALEKRGIKVFEPDIVKAQAGFDVSQLTMVGGKGKHRR